MTKFYYGGQPNLQPGDIVEPAHLVETLRQTIRTYDDATMTNNSELANIALNSNALSVIPGLAAEYERCYQ